MPPLPQRQCDQRQKRPSGKHQREDDMPPQFGLLETIARSARPSEHPIDGALANAQPPRNLRLAHTLSRQPLDLSRLGACGRCPSYLPSFLAAAMPSLLQRETPVSECIKPDEPPDAIDPVVEQQVASDIEALAAAQEHRERRRIAVIDVAGDFTMTTLTREEARTGYKALADLGVDVSQAMKADDVTAPESA